MWISEHLLTAGSGFTNQTKMPNDWQAIFMIMNHPIKLWTPSCAFVAKAAILVLYAPRRYWPTFREISFRFFRHPVPKHLLLVFSLQNGKMAPLEKNRKPRRSNKVIFTLSLALVINPIINRNNTSYAWRAILSSSSSFFSCVGNLPEPKLWRELCDKSTAATFSGLQHTASIRIVLVNNGWHHCSIHSFCVLSFIESTGLSVPWYEY